MTQIDRGPLGYRSTTVNLPGLTLTWETIGGAMRSIQHWQERGLFVGFLIRATVPLLWQGQEIAPFSPLVFGSQQQDMILPSNCLILTVAVHEHQAGALGISDLSPGLWHADSACARDFVSACKVATVHTLHPAPLTPRSPQQKAILADQLIGRLLTLLEHPLNISPSRQYCVMRKAEAFLNDTGMDESLCIDHVADAIGVSRRTMHRAFKDLFDMGPKGYMRLVRLHQFRRTLLEGGTSCVTNAALDAGFDHFGRAAQYYKAQFGELPRDTLGRAG